MKNKFDALALALKAVGLDENEIWNVQLCREGRLVYVRFDTQWLGYELYVDCEAGTVPGLSSCPICAELPQTAEFAAMAG